MLPALLPPPDRPPAGAATRPPLASTTSMTTWSCRPPAPAHTARCKVCHACAQWAPPPCRSTTSPSGSSHAPPWPAPQRLDLAFPQVQPCSAASVMPKLPCRHQCLYVCSTCACTQGVRLPRSRHLLAPPQAGTALLCLQAVSSARRYQSRITMSNRSFVGSTRRILGATGARGNSSMQPLHLRTALD